ncbi:flippase activity-associated protein Agl23 [Halorussus halophilus]|uniref:flippase activity-associated protein Agl23 n=1 Tax=Halorussus halophilus TaxID=2650975 RepID=UPI0013011365|nr:flippase activity-associated protein Agl23 [Halorussus halophilus]
MASQTETSMSGARIRETVTSYASRTAIVVGAITVLALALRLFALGARVAHQDEARVAYWAYRLMETGVNWYRPYTHGPFLTTVNSWIFEWFGATDFTMRVVVAVLSGLFPLTALLFRERLRESETILMALFLALNPLLLYFSRFYRNDVLLAGFMLAAFGFFVRAYDTRRPAYLFAGTAIFALAFTTKENALVYPVCWAGAAFLLWDRRMLFQRAGERGVFSAVWDSAAGIARGLFDWAHYFALAVVEFFAIIVFFYAPRGDASQVPKPTLGQTMSDPTLFPALVEEATIGSWHRFTGVWGGGNQESYLGAAKALWPAFQEGAIFLFALAIIGFVVDRYTGDSPRDVVEFTFLWGAFSILGYPVIVDNPFPWEPIHAIVPLVVPAAVGLALVVRLGLDSIADGDALSATAAALVVLVLAAQVGATAVNTSYMNPQDPDNEFVQYAQSSSDMKPLLSEMQTVIESNPSSRIDVMYYGRGPDDTRGSDDLYAPDPNSHLEPHAGDGWFARLPFAWYLETYEAQVDSAEDPQILRDTKPPVVIAYGNVSTCDKEYDSASDIDQFMDGYERHEVQRYNYDSGCTVSTMVIYINEDATSSE